MKSSNLVTIIILNWNGIRETRKCIRSLLKVSDIPLNILIIDNGSKNNEADRIKSEFEKKVTIIALKENLGFTGGANHGIAYAKKYFDPEWFLLLNKIRK
jgi:GT2 family glycosyltransferase